MPKDYSSYGPAYRNFIVRDDVYVPEPVADFSGDDPFTKMTTVRGGILRQINFDDTYPYLDKSFKYRLNHFLCYFVAYVPFPLIVKLRYGLRIFGRDKIKKNKDLFKNGAMTVCNHVFRWDMGCVLRASRYHKSWIPMYSPPFLVKDHWALRYVGGIPIPDNRKGLRKFDEAFDELHAKKQWIHIFPESCSWKFYSPIRPFKPGAFNMAYKYDIPVIPMAISFRERKRIYNLFGKEPLVDLHVGDPLIPDKSKPRKEETLRLCELAPSSMVEMAGILSNPWPAHLD